MSFDGEDDVGLTHLCICIDKNNKMTNDRYCVFYVNASSPMQEIQYFYNSIYSDKSAFMVRTDKMPKEITKIGFCVVPCGL